MRRLALVVLGIALVGASIGAGPAYGIDLAVCQGDPPSCEVTQVPEPVASSVVEIATTQGLNVGCGIVGQQSLPGADADPRLTLCRVNSSSAHASDRDYLELFGGGHTISVGKEHFFDAIGGSCYTSYVRLRLDATELRLGDPSCP